MKNKDWTGNTKSVFSTLGANSHSEHDYEEHSFYATDPNSLRTFLDEYHTQRKLSNKVWECACGNGVLSEVLKEYGYEVISTDLIDRGYGTGGGRFPLTDR